MEIRSDTKNSVNFQTIHASANAKKFFFTFYFAPHLKYCEIITRICFQTCWVVVERECRVQKYKHKLGSKQKTVKKFLFSKRAIRKTFKETCEHENCEKEKVFFCFLANLWS